MFRIEIAVILLALLPLTIAVVFRTAVVPKRKSDIVNALKSAEEQPLGEVPDGSDYVRLGANRVSEEFESQYSFRLFLPTSILSVLYLVGFSLALLLLMAESGQHCSDWFCGELKCISYTQLQNSIAAFIGCYVFNTGVLIRRAFIADITKNIFWGSINRIVFTIGISLAISWSPIRSKESALLASFAIAFFPGLFITWLRKIARKPISLTDTSLKELDIQLVQGIDIWKEERLEEEGIESVQTLATADALTLAVKTHYPLRTILDWIDQAILIQRFPSKFRRMQDAGLAVSAIELCRIARNLSDPLIRAIALKIDLEESILAYSMQAMYEDEAIQHIWHLWQTRDSDE